MKALISRYVLGPLGLAYEVCKPPSLTGVCPVLEVHRHSRVDSEAGMRKPSLHSFSEPAVDQTKQATSAGFSGETTCWELCNVGLKAGWYMLEIEHSLQSIGCVLTIDSGAEHRQHMLLTSKPVCKRIIRFVRPVSRCVVQIDQPGCTLARVSFKRLTGSFADRRMRQRLSNRGRVEQTDAPDLDLLYSAYNTHVHDGIFELAYRSKPIDYSHVSPTLVANERRANIALVLVPASEDVASVKSDVSVNSALRFARQCGWQVDWQRVDESSVEVLDRCSKAGVFIMPVLPRVDYRIDIFHQMLNAIDPDNILVYADHDHVDESGLYHSPVLKPEWNPELLLNMNYIQLPWMISAPWVCKVLEQSDTGNRISRVLLAAAMGIKKTGDGSKNIRGKAEQQSEQLNGCELALISDVEDISPLANRQVKRIPIVLASVHAASNSVGGNTFFDTEQWYQQVCQSLKAAGKQADVVQGIYKRGHHIRWSLPADEPSVDIIIPTRDKVDLLQTCVESILTKTSYGNFRLLIVDNGSAETSTEEYYRSINSEKRCSVLNYSGTFNYSAINNFAVEQSHADVIVLLNNDTEVIAPEWLDELVRQSMRPDIGCVGAKLYYSNGRIQHGGVIVGITGVAGHAHRYSSGDAEGYRGRLLVSQNFSAVTAACLAVRRSVWLQAGGLDHEYLGVAWNDVDFCLKVQALGFRNLWTPFAELYHHEGLSRGADDTRSKVDRVEAERQVMMERWGLGNLTDPAYHPLLTRDNESFSLGRLMG